MSNRSFHIVAAGLAMIGAAPVAHAQAAPSAAPAQANAATAPAGARAPRPVTRTSFIAGLDANYKTLDANKDGAVALAEIQAAQARSEQAVEALMVKRRAEMFAKFDTNKDGQLSAAEFNAGSPIPQRPKSDAAKALAQLDSNKDQKVSVIEFRAPPLANFDKMDLNRDGTVSVDEQNKARPAAK